MKDLISINDLSPEEVAHLVNLGIRIKANPEAFSSSLKGKTLGMIFEKASTRTRVSFEVGMYQLGGSALFLSARDIQLHRGEPISDTAQVLSRYLDGIMARTFAHQDVVDLARFGSIPVINGLTDLLHPCQALTDLMTVQEHFGGTSGKKFCYIGDGNNMAHSLMLAAPKAGMDFAYAAPKGYEVEREIWDQALSAAAAAGTRITETVDPAEAIAGAHVVYTDVWASMGQEEESAKRIQDFQGFEVNSALMGHADPNAIFMHCLPAHRGEEVSAEVCDGPQSVIFDQAENRLHLQKAIMVHLMSDED